MASSPAVTAGAYCQQDLDQTAGTAERRRLQRDDAGIGKQRLLRGFLELVQREEHVAPHRAYGLAQEREGRGRHAN